MKLSDFVTVKSIHGFRVKRKGFVAILGEVTCEGETRDLAVQGLFKKVKDYSQRCYHREYFFSPSGKTTFVLYPSIMGGWNYDIMSPAHKHPSTCMMGGTLEEASKSVARHAASYEEVES